MKKILIVLSIMLLVILSCPILNAQNNDDMFYQKAVENYQAGNILEAKTNIWNALSINKEEINYYILLAMIHQKDRDYSQAHRVLMMAKMRAPENFRVYEFLGHNEFYCGNFETAINYYNYAKNLKSATPQDKTRLDNYIVETRNTKK